ncbi:site-specific integrase [Ruminococcus sp. Marseille-P6503]|uniref:tyrosine-type recombinase/integrase n=1 Tax=Ruminococcus sp. Marseille-P6503 TaxID=2364796 RepID=UPI000F523365|nr:site-specific integrase [Ruminococcus sp. Marseille-P6503]
MNITEYSQTWLKEYKEGIVRSSTLVNYRYAIGYADMALHDTAIEEADITVIKDAFVTLKNLGYSKNTIKIVKRVLSQVFEQAVQDNIIAYNPVAKADIPHDAHERRIASYSESEQSSLINAALKDKQGDAVLFLLFTGLRRCELLNLKWSDYNVKDHLIYIRSSKTENGIREVFLSHQAERLINTQPRMEHGYIFSTSKGRPISAGSLKKTYMRLRRVTGNKKITLHRCRHTFCSKLSDKGVSPKIIAELAGHSNVSFTMQRYVHPSREQKMKAVSLLD